MLLKKAVKPHMEVKISDTRKSTSESNVNSFRAGPCRPDPGRHAPALCLKMICNGKPVAIKLLAALSLAMPNVLFADPGPAADRAAMYQQLSGGYKLYGHDVHFVRSPSDVETLTRSRDSSTVRLAKSLASLMQAENDCKAAQDTSFEKGKVEISGILVGATVLEGEDARQRLGDRLDDYRQALNEYRAAELTAATARHQLRISNANLIDNVASQLRNQPATPELSHSFIMGPTYSRPIVASGAENAAMTITLSNHARSDLHHCVLITRMVSNDKFSQIASNAEGTGKITDHGIVFTAAGANEPSPDPRLGLDRGDWTPPQTRMIYVPEWKLGQDVQMKVSSVLGTMLADSGEWSLWSDEGHLDHQSLELDKASVVINSAIRTALASEQNAAKPAVAVRDSSQNPQSNLPAPRLLPNLKHRLLYP